MVLTVHHLQVSQSERIPWLCEELGLKYELKTYKRSPLLSPPAYLALHPLGAAPVITDGDLTLAESGACMEYIIHTYGHGKFVVKPGEKGYTDYLYWYHFANGTLQPTISRAMSLSLASVGEDNNVRVRVQNRLTQCLTLLDQRLEETGKWLVGEEFTAADVMVVFSLTTMRRFYGFSLEGFAGVLGYLRRVGEREGYQRAMGKGDPEMDWRGAMKGEPPEGFVALAKR